MSNLRLTQAKQLLQQARKLREQVQENIRTQSFTSDDVCMEAYNDLIEVAANLFPEDPTLNGQMIKMPDAITQNLDWQLLIRFPKIPFQRTEERLTRLINRLEILLGEEPEQQPLDERDFSFVADHGLREVLMLDFIEAQKSFAAGAYKACGLLCGGLIEGMLLDISQRPSIATEQQLDETANKLKLPRSGQSIDWDKISMTNLIKMSSEWGVVSSTALRFTEGARDVRDTIHPRAELRQGRVNRDEASMLLDLVMLIYNGLIARLGEDEKKE